MNRTLPLFDGLETPRPPAAEPAPDTGAMPRPAAGSMAAPGDRHLRAAWRLSRGMWRHPDHSPEQTRAGLAICRHLQALLAESRDGVSAGRE